MQTSVIEKVEKLVKEGDDSFLGIISEIILENIGSIETLQIKDISDRSHYSISSITKFCQKLGCKGWKDFKTSLLMQSDYFNKNKKIDGLLFDKNEDRIIENLQEHSILSIKKAWQGNAKQIIKLKKYIEDYDKIFIYGIGFNQVIIKHFIKNLLLLNKNCIFNEDIEIQKQLSKLKTKNTLHIIFSFSGTTSDLKSVVDNISQQKASQARIATFTGNINSYIAEKSDLILLLSENETPLREVSYQGTFFLINVLISLLLKDQTKNQN